jgi:hypothetical protein
MLIAGFVCVCLCERVWSAVFGRSQACIIVHGPLMDVGLGVGGGGILSVGSVDMRGQR